MQTELLLLFFLGSVLPLVVELVTKWHAPDWIKNVVNMGLALLVTAVQQSVDALGAGEDFVWRDAGVAFIVTWAASTFAYMKLWRNTPVITAIASATSNVGITGPAGPMTEARPEPKMHEVTVSYVSQD